jgi:predicted nucleotidyltransferase
MRHHDRAIERYLARTTTDPEVLGVLLTGSLATRSERADSDIDLVVVVTDDTWREAVATDRIMFVDRDEVGYEGGYFDVKLATLDQLTAAAERADDPARSSLGNAEVRYDQGFDLESIVRRITEGAPPDRQDLTASFVAQARLHGEYFLAHGVQHDDAFLAAHAATHLGLAAGRALLADAGTLYPGPKDLMATLRALPDPGARFAAAITEVARVPSRGSARALLDLVEQHLGSTLPEAATLSRFVMDNELAWFRRIPPPEHR